MTMEETTTFLDVPSPSNSYQYLYGDHDQYLDASHSESHSSATSPYDMTFSGDFTGTSPFPSPESRDTDERSESPHETSATTETQPKPAAKRKRENRYKNAPPSVLSRRRAQNRASQRAYRERKDQRIKDLEQMLDDAHTRNDVLGQAYAELHAEYVKLKSTPSPAAAHEAAAAAYGRAPPQPQPHSHSHSHPHSHALASSMPTSYAAIHGTSLSAAGLSSAGFVDATSMAALNAGSDLEAYLFPEVASYTL